MQKQLFIVTNASDTIIAATHVALGDQKGKTYITAGPGQKMYIISVPEEIAEFKNFKDGDEFHKALSNHFQSKDVKLSLIERSSKPNSFR